MAHWWEIIGFFFPVTKGLEETQRCDIQTKSLLVIAELSPFGRRTIVTMVTASIYTNQWCAGDRQSHGYFFGGEPSLGEIVAFKSQPSIPKDMVFVSMGCVRDTRYIPFFKMIHSLHRW